MVNPDQKIPQADLSSGLQRLMFLRVLFVSLLLGASIFIQANETRAYFGDIQTSHYALIAVIYCLTFVYIILLKHSRNLVKMAYLQLISDTFLITALIYATGGIESIFSFLYILIIIYGSIILYRKGGMIVASSSSILYGLLLDLHYYGIIEPIGSRLSYQIEYQSPSFFYMLVVNIAAFYLVAFLGSYASEQTRKTRVELRAKQNDLIKLEALNEWIIQSITSALITLDDEGRIILFNPAAEEIFGIPAAQAVSRPLDEVLPSLREAMGNGLKGSIGHGAGKKPYVPMDVPYVRSDGEKMFLQTSVSPLSLPGGNQRGQILFFQDMTAMRQIEAEMKKVEGLALAGQLAAGIAHEIRNPMASISGSIQILKEGLKKDAMSSRLMDIILREISRLNHLVSDFLLFARPKAADVQAFDLNELIRDSLELFRNRGEWSHKVNVETALNGPLRIESDPEQIKQLLWNLYLNAFDAMTEGGTLHIATDEVDDKRAQRRYARITIRDTGKGFSKEALDHLFTPFFTTKEGGSGLGLAIVKRIVEGLRGEVYGQNHADGGAEITLLLDSSLSLSS
jgi:two-component system sensor histidine kinase PilS (NtrC family)